MRLKDKVAIVTGGGSGFGEAIAKRFAEEGAKLVINDVNDANGTRVAKEIEGAQGQGSARYVRADVSRNDDMAQLISASVDRYGHVDLMVNNAGITHVNRPMLEVGEEEFDRIYAVNVKSIYLAARHLVPVLRKQGKGRIDHQHSLDRGHPAPAWPCLVQRLQRRSDHAHQRHGGRARPRQDPCQRALPGGGRHAAVAELPRRLDGSASPSALSPRCRSGRLSTPKDVAKRRALSCLGRSRIHHRRRAGGRWGTVHLTAPDFQ